MRLRVMEDILSENVIKLVLEYEDITEAGKSKFKINNMSEVFTIISNIEEFGFIKNEIKLLEGNGNIFNDKSSSIVIDPHIFQNILNTIDMIKQKTIAVIQAIGKAIPEQSENSVSFKLPPINDLKELQTVIKDIDTIISQSVASKFHGKVTLQNFDTGSNWIEICIENKEAILFLGSLIKGSIDLIKGYYIQWKQTRHMVSTLEVDEQAKATILKALENSVDAQARFYAKTLMDEYKISSEDQEYHTHLTHSIEKFADLISRGAEVRTALNAPEDTRQAFPNVTEETQALIENTIQLLADGSQDNVSTSNTIEGESDLTEG